jgi:hypothetical protein
MSGYSGRIIFPKLARIAPTDYQGTAAPQGDFDSGFDSHFREPRYLPDGDSQTGASARRELEPVNVPCQVEDDVWEQLQMMRSGNSSLLRITLVFHYTDLEYMGLIDAPTQEATVPRVGDRLASILNTEGALLQSIPEDRPVFCQQATWRSFGLTGGGKNLLVCVFESRDVSERGSG